MSDWTNFQERGIDSVREALRRRQSVCMTAPTGFGKTRMSSRIAEMAASKGSRWLFLTHRRMLFGQTVKAFDEAGLSFGCIAAEWQHWENPDAIGQVAMVQTLMARTRSEEGYDLARLPEANLVMIDEWHANKAGFCADVVAEYKRRGARIVGTTATPLGLTGLADELVVIASNTEARDVKAILPAIVYTPDEVDLSDVRTKSYDDEFSQEELAKRFKRHQVVGRVYEHWLKLNPSQLPSLGFAPGVEESMWFCDQFIARGVRCAHIDGEKVYLGERDDEGNPIVYRDKLKRDEVAEGSRTGFYKVVWNRFVMREGVDWPWLYCGMFATAFSTPDGWLQSAGRILRYWPDYDHVLIIDHGGNCYRPGLGDPNADREWSLEDTNGSIVKAAKQKMERPTGEQDEQLKCCPQCHRPVESQKWRANNFACPWCQFAFKHSVRNVIQTDGSLVKVRGNAVKVKSPPTGQVQKAWDSIVFPSRKSKNKFASTFEQAANRFQREFPHLRLHTSTDAVFCVDRNTGEKTRLSRVPSPGSPNWKRRIRDVDFKELQ